MSRDKTSLLNTEMRKASRSFSLTSQPTSPGSPLTSSSRGVRGQCPPRTIPIVGIDLESDPVAKGFVKSLARPSGNITGMFLDLAELSGKQLEILKESRLAPSLPAWPFSGTPPSTHPNFGS